MSAALHRILMSSVVADDRTRVLKHADAFGVFDHHGDIVPDRPRRAGLLQPGNPLSLRVPHRSRRRAALLPRRDHPQRARAARHQLHQPGSRAGRRHPAARHDPSLGADLPVAGRAPPADRRHQLRERRRRRRDHAALRGRLRRHLRGPRHAAGRAGHRPRPDRRDGPRRARIPGPRPDRAAERDRILDRAGGTRSRERAIRAQPAVGLRAHPRRLDRMRARAELPDVARSFAEAWREAEGDLERHRSRACRVRTGSERANAWFERASDDLHMLTTELASGPYPYAGIPWFNTPFGRDGILTALPVPVGAPRARQGRAPLPRFDAGDRAASRGRMQSRARSSTRRAPERWRGPERCRSGGTTEPSTRRRSS